LKIAESVENRTNTRLRNLISITPAAFAGIHHAAAMDVVRDELHKGQLFTQSGTNTQNITIDYDCDYYFTVPWQNMQPQPANATFTGPGENVLNDTVTFAILVEHAPQSAPQTLTP
jgi:hypothetical protein